MGAIADLGAALFFDPQYENAYYRRGVIRQNRHDIDGAIADYKEALRLNPRNDLLCWGLGDCYYEKQLFDEALIYYRQYLDLAGKNSDYYVVERIEELENPLL